MANLLNHNKNFIKLIPDMSEYYDFFLGMNEPRGYDYGIGGNLYDKCLISYIDTTVKDSVSGNGEYVWSLDNYSYESAVSSDYTLYNIGYTGVDNGLFKFNKTAISNVDFVKIYRDSTYHIESGDNRLKLHEVSGSTERFQYPLSYDGENIKLNGGFLQGFFETEKGKYQVLPSKMCDYDNWHLEFEIMKKNFESESEKTLNDSYPENKGIFFYMGTRSENKWIYLYNDTDSKREYYTESGDGYIYDDYKQLDMDDGYNHPFDYILPDLPDPYSIDGYMVEGNNIVTTYKFDVSSDYSKYNDPYFRDEYDIGESCEWKDALKKYKQCECTSATPETGCGCNIPIGGFIYDDYYYEDSESGSVSVPSVKAITSSCKNNLYYVETSVTSENICYTGNPFDDLSSTPYQDYKSCRCNYFPNWEQCTNSPITPTPSPCSVCCHIPVSVYMYDMSFYDAVAYVAAKGTCKSCSSSETDSFMDGYEDTSADCNSCDTYLADYDSGYLAKDIELSDFEFDTEEEYQINLAGYYEITTDNGFLIYDRTCEGYTVNTWNHGDFITLYGRKKSYIGNLFIYLNRTCSGYTVNDMDALTESNEKNYDYEKDLYRNAFALQIRDDGSIGYKYLVKNCDATSSDTETYSILSGFSMSGIIQNDKWYTVNVRIIPIKADKMKLYFYINGKLKFISSILPRFNFKKLDMVYAQQEGVPFNISIGGGSQGLCDVIMPKYLKIYDTPVYPIEKNFAGSFIGYFRKFRFYNCKMNLNGINNNYLFDKRGHK